MTAPVARHATEYDHGMLDGYIDFCRRLQVSDRALRDRFRAARTLLADYPDLQRWLGRPVQSRVSDLRRSSAWPMVGWAILTGRVMADLDLLLIKDFGTLGTTAELLFDADFADARAAAGRLGWSPTWARSIVREALVLTIAATGRTMRQLTDQDLEQLRCRIDASPLITEASRQRHKAQLCRRKHSTLRGSAWRGSLAATLAWRSAAVSRPLGRTATTFTRRPCRTPPSS